MPERYRFARASPTRGKLAEAPWTLGHATLICTCLAGAAPTRRIEDGLAAAGFTDIRIAIKPRSRELGARPRHRRLRRFRDH